MAADLHSAIDDLFLARCDAFDWRASRSRAGARATARR